MSSLHSPYFPPLPSGGGFLDEGRSQDSQPDVKEKLDFFVSSSHSIRKCPSASWLLAVARTSCRHGV